MPNYRTLATVTADYFFQHPDEIDDFLTELFADYAEDGDSATLHSALDIVAQAKDIQQLMSRPFDSSAACIPAKATIPMRSHSQSTNQPIPQPLLHGITILDLTRILAGPYCTMTLLTFMMVRRNCLNSIKLRQSIVTICLKCYTNCQ